MKKVKRWLSGLLAVGMLVTGAGGVTYAATGHVIKSVSIKVKAHIEPGSDLSEDTINITDALGDGEVGCSVTVSSDRYYVESAEWASKYKNIRVGDTPKIKVHLKAYDTDEYYFNGSYGNNNISVSGGEYGSVSKKSKSELILTVRTNPIRGTYEAPEDAYWRENQLGHAKWSSVEYSSDAYDVYLYRGSTIVKKVEKLKNTSYNFYPYMTKEGTYTFRVRTVPYSDNQTDVGKRSEWSHSDELYIDKNHVSDGSGQGSDSSGGGTTSVGWIHSDGSWFYKYPDGSYQKNSWAQIQEKWYLFGTDGRMKTGWQTHNGLTYFLKPEGDMFAGWMQDGGKWYYLNESKQDVEGALAKNSWVQYGDKLYYVDANGAMAEGWQQVAGNWYYFYPGSGQKAVNTYIDTFYVDENGIWKR